MKVVQKFDSSCNPESYTAEVVSKNKNRIKKVQQGMHDLNNINFLKVVGKNQLFKEIMETKHLVNKEID